MIFVTVGTHEQQFDRLIKEIDRISKKSGNLDVFIQTGYSDYIPSFCSYKKMIGYKEMVNYSEKSQIIITHGGPGSIMLPWQYNKVPIVVPRNPDFGEHVDEHQILFTKRLEALKKIIAVYDINTLEDKIVNYDYYNKQCNCNFENNTKKFTEKVEIICNNMLNGGRQ